jgi:hypothetical protein
MVLDFRNLTWFPFERLCLWLARREGYSNVEHLAGGGPQLGLDLRATKDQAKVGFQCKNVQRFGPRDVKKAVEEVLNSPREGWPDVLVLVVSSLLTPEARRAAKVCAGEHLKVEFWSGTELDELVKRHPAIVREFFPLQRLPSDWTDGRPPLLLDPDLTRREQRLVGDELEVPTEIEVLGTTFALLPAGRTTSATLLNPTYLALSPLRKFQWNSVVRSPSTDSPARLEDFQRHLSVKDIKAFVAAGSSEISESGQPWELDFPTSEEWRYASGTQQKSLDLSSRAMPC